MMDSDGPTTGKPNASRYLQGAEVPSLLDKVMQRWRTWLVVLVVRIVGIYYLSGRSSSTDSAADSATAIPHTAVPVAAVPARLGDLKQYISAIGTVTAYNTVTVKSRVDGQLNRVNFSEGQIVKAGDLLAEIDPRPYQVDLTQAEGTLAKDLANLENNKILFARDKELYDQKIIARQDLDNQQALVGQYAGSIESDKGAVDNAKLQLVYSRITSPITGRVGLRLVDPGNIVHATDTTGMLVITQIDPISVLFSLPEDQVPVVLQKLNAGQRLQVDAFDRSSDVLLAHGYLATVDNQIDPTTGSLRWRANFDNPGYKLFPNQFVNVRLLVQLKQGVTLAPSATIQRNSQNTYVFLVQPNSTVTVRTVTIGTVEGNDSEITSGLQPGY